MGRRQARALARRLKAEDFDLVFSSDLKRALETATLALPQAEVQTTPLLREVNFGVYEGQTMKTLDEQGREEVLAWWKAPYSHKLKGGESMECLNKRVESWMSELPEEGRIAVFAHGGLIRNAVWQIVGKPTSGEWSVAIENTSLTVIEYGPQRTLLQRVNDRAHLEQ